MSEVLASFTAEQDETGAWYARSDLGRFGFAFGEGQMARDWRHRRLPMKAAAYGRLPLQLPLVAWALNVARTAR